MGDKQFNNMAHFDLQLSTGDSIQLWVEVEPSIKAKWVEAEMLSGTGLVVRVLSKKPRAKKVK